MLPKVEDFRQNYLCDFHLRCSRGANVPVKNSKSYLSNRLGLVHFGQLCLYVVFLQKRLLLINSHLFFFF
jgi:hypothetical protein